MDGFGGYSQYSIRTSFGKFTARGWMYGGAAGLAIPVKGAFIDLVAETNQQGYGDAEVGGGAFEDSDVSGYRALLRASLRIPLGN